MIKAYYDGSADSKRQVAITLAGAIAPDSLWREINSSWSDALHSHQIGVPFHMADFMAGVGQFSKFDTAAKKNAVLLSLFQVMAKFAHVESGHRLALVACTVMLGEHAAARRRVERLREPESMCVDFCFSGVQYVTPDSDEPRPILLYFDQKERFMHKIHYVWQRVQKRACRVKRGWPYQIRGIFPVNSTNEFYPIQMADVVAWLINRKCCNPDDLNSQRHLMMVFSGMVVQRVYDSAAAIIERYPKE